MNSAKVLGAPVDQGRLVSPQRMGAVICAVQADIVAPMSQESRVLPGPVVGRIAHPAREQKILRLQTNLLEPCLHRDSGSRCDLKLPERWLLSVFTQNAEFHALVAEIVSDREVLPPPPACEAVMRASLTEQLLLSRVRSDASITTNSGTLIGSTITCYLREF